MEVTQTKTTEFKTDITEEEFKSYEEVRVSGVTNMYNVSLVSDLSDLSKDKIMLIMKNYEQLMDFYPNVRRWVLG